MLHGSYSLCPYCSLEVAKDTTLNYHIACRNLQTLSKSIVCGLTARHTGTAVYCDRIICILNWDWDCLLWCVNSNEETWTANHNYVLSDVINTIKPPPKQLYTIRTNKQHFLIYPSYEDIPDRFIVYVGTENFLPTSLDINNYIYITQNKFTF